MKRFVFPLIISVLICAAACGKIETKTAPDAESVLQRVVELSVEVSRQREELSVWRSERSEARTEELERLSESESEEPVAEEPTTEESTLGEFIDPGCPDIPEVWPDRIFYTTTTTRPATTKPETTAAPICWRGVDPYRDVYVSKSGHKVHNIPYCSGMKYYYTMQAYKAYNYGYSRCQNCW